MSSDSGENDPQSLKVTSSGQLPASRSRSSRGMPAQVDPSILPSKEASAGSTWVRKVPPVIGMRERGMDGSNASEEVGEVENSEIGRSASPLDPQSTRSRTISANTLALGGVASVAERTKAVEMETPPVSPKQTNWTQAPAASVRLGTHGHKEGRKMTIPVAQEVKSPMPFRTGTLPVAEKPNPPTTPTPDAITNQSLSLPKIIPNQSMPLLSTLFEQTSALLDRKEEDWAIANYDQLRHVISQLFNSVPLIRQMLALVKRIAPIFIERRQEREATNRYKEVMYLAEKIGGDAAAEQIELNLLVADSYILRSELALNDQELSVNIAAYANEALWLCHTYKLHDRLADCKAKIDLAEALFCSIFLVNTNIVLRLTQILKRKPQDFSRVFKLVERTLHQLFKHQSWLMIRKLYQSGILQACTQASQSLNDDSYLLQMLYIQTQVNLTLLQPSEVGKVPSSSSSNSSSNASSKTSLTAADKMRSSSISLRKSSSSSAEALAGFSGWLPKDVPSNWSEFRSQLEAMRSDINVSELAQNLLQPEYVQTVQISFNQKLTALIKQVFDYCVEMVGDPPCPFSVFALGSLSRGEAAPYSDLEYGFLLADESKRESGYWKDLWTIFEFTFICFGERVGLHTDDQGSPKTPTFRGTPSQLLELFLNPLDAHDISTAFSMLRPLFVSSYPNTTGRDLHDTYINLVNKMLLSTCPDGFHQYTKIGCLFLDDHLSQLPKWLTRDNEACVELKTNFIQPLVFSITDVALASGSYVNCTNAGVCQLVDILGDGKNSHLGFSSDFSRSIKTMFLACYGLKILAQLHYHEQFEGDKVSITPPPTQAPSGNASPPPPTNTIGSIYYLTREQVYWLIMAQSVVFKPLFSVLPHILTYSQTNPFILALPSTPQTSFEPHSGLPKNWTRIDPIIDAAEQLVDPKFDPYNSSRPTALEDTKDLIRNLVATLIFRDAAISRYRHYYKPLASDFKLLYRAAVTSHASTQGARVQMLSYVFDSYASQDGTRPLIERLKAHFKDHMGSIEPTSLQKVLASWDPKLGPLAAAGPVYVKVLPPVGWPSQSRLKPLGTTFTNETLISTAKPVSVAKFEGQLGYELVFSLVHFALIGYGAPLLDLRMVAPAPKAKEIPVVFVETIPGEPLSLVLASDPNKFKQLDSKSFTELVLVNIVLMCNASASDFVFEPLSDDPRRGYRLGRTNFGTATPSPEPITITKERVTLNVCNILFCMSSMLQTVHPHAVEEFVSLNPTHLMTRLVQDLESYNKDWKAKIDVAATAQFNRLVQPTPLPSNTALINIPHYVLSLFFDRIVKLQKVLTQSPRATHLDLLRAVDPIVGQIYADVLSQNSSMMQNSLIAIASGSVMAPSTTILDRAPLLQASGSNSNANANETIERLTRLESKSDFSLAAIFGVPSTSPKLFARIDRLRKSSHALLPSSLPTTEPIFEKADHFSHIADLKTQVMNLPANSISFPREDMLKNSSMKEKLLCSINFGKIEAKKQRQTVLSLFDTVKFTSQLRIRNCPELDHQRLSKLLSGDTVKHLTLLDLRGMTGIKQPTLTLIASLENLEYLNLSQSDIKSISVEKWTKREPLMLDKIVWLSLSRCTGLQHIILRAPNLRHLDIAGNTSLSEFKVLSAFKVSLIGTLSPQIAFSRVFSEIPSTSWYHSTDSVPAPMEKLFYDVASGRDHRLLIHIPLNEATGRIVAEVVRHSPTLEIVDLSNSVMLSDDTIDHVVSAAIANPSVKSLDLTGCGAKPAKVMGYAQQCSVRTDLKARF